MSRIDNIYAYKIRQEEKAKNAIDEKKIKFESLCERIYTLNKRIAELIETANACLESGIEIDMTGRTQFIGYDTHEDGSFMTNMNTHRVGFVRTWRYAQKDAIKRVSEMGIDAGGACGNHSFRTNGTEVYSVDVNNPKKIYCCEN